MSLIDVRPDIRSMAEETRNPSRTVPRVMWTTTILHHLMVYIQVAMFIVIVAPLSMGVGGISPSVSSYSIYEECPYL